MSKHFDNYVCDNSQDVYTAITEIEKKSFFFEKKNTRTSSATETKIEKNNFFDFFFEQKNILLANFF